MSELLQIEKRGHIAVMTINNPPANTWTAESLSALKAIIEDLNGDSNIFALVVTGQGEKFFSAGADLKAFADGDRGPGQRTGPGVRRCFCNPGQFPRPVHRRDQRLRHGRWSGVCPGL